MTFEGALLAQPVPLGKFADLPPASRTKTTGHDLLMAHMKIVSIDGLRTSISGTLAILSTCLPKTSSHEQQVLVPGTLKTSGKIATRLLGTCG